MVLKTADKLGGTWWTGLNYCFSPERVSEAEALLQQKKWSGAYYLAGYATECGLKACVLVHIEKTGVIFQDKKFASSCWTHDIEELVKLASLGKERGLDVSSNPNRATNWLIVSDWNEIARYQRWSETQARELYDAITNRTNGVLPWIKSHW